MWVAEYLVIAGIAGAVDGVEVVSVGQEVILVLRHCRVWEWYWSLYESMGVFHFSIPLKQRKSLYK